MERKFTSWLPLILFATCLLAASPARAQDPVAHDPFDLNKDGDVNVGDVTTLINRILGKDKPEPEPGETDAAVTAGLCPDANHPHQIDMGAAGKWACCNVGASNPFEYGSYYAWGEKEEKSEYSEDTYAYNHYGRYDDLGDISGNRIYDVAAAEWGGTWKMPPSDRTKLLLDCSNEWTTMNEVNGRLFTASNGNRIFLPAAGYRYYSDLKGDDRGGFYWSSTPHPSYSGNTYSLEFARGNAYWDGNDDRYYGLSVRPVTD